MSARRPWIWFERRGGLPPRDDEELRLAADGSFAARRTVDGRRIGVFEGRLSTAALARLRAAVEAAAGAGDLALPTPRHGATETLEVAGHTLRLGSNETPPKPWRGLVGRLRKLFQDEVVDNPRAAVELVADARTARLVHAGDDPLDVDLGSVAVRVIHLADDGGVLGRWTGWPTEGLVDNGERLVPTPAWATAEPGWSASLPFDHGLELGAGDWLQVWVEVAIRDDDGTRHGQLYLPVLRDA